MIPITALWAALLAVATSVSGVSIVPANDRTEVVIEVDGPVTYNTFTLSNPARLVVDMTGARQKLPQSRFAGINRGGVVGLRASQFQPNVARIVLDLAKPVEYTVKQEGNRILISFPNPAGEFSPWHSGGSVSAMATKAAPTASDAAPSPDVTRIDTGTPIRPLDSASEPVATASIAPPVAQPVVRPSKPRITIYFQNTPIDEVIAAFAEFSGRSIVMGAGITGTVNADIRNQEWDVALDALLPLYGLAAQEMESGIIRVDKVENMREQEKLEELLTRSFTIKYATVDSIMPAIQGLLSERGKVTRNSATNTLIVTDGRSVIEGRVAPMIEQLDKRTAQVTIAAKIIFVDRTAIEELGIVYDIKDTRGNQFNSITTGAVDVDGDGVFDIDMGNDDAVLLRGRSIAALGNAKSRLTSPALQVMTSLAMGRHQLINFIDALSELRVTDIQAAPVVTTLDHREAHVQVGEETPVRVVDVGSAGGTGAPPRATVQMKNTGIILRVTPHVTGNQVLLDLHAERSNIAAGPSDAGIIFQKQVSGTQVLVNNGETAVISGLTIIEKTESRSGFPILKDLPLIGRLFRTTIDRESKKDLLIMVTPHIIRED